MRHLLRTLALAALAGCSSGSSTGPSGGGGGGTGGDMDGGGGGTPPPATASVIVGNISFRSARDGSTNPAVDEVAVGGTVTWTWTGTGNIPHSVRSVGNPSFPSSEILTGDGRSYQATFSAPGTYHYDCAVHGGQMTGTVVVRSATATSSKETQR